MPGENNSHSHSSIAKGKRGKKRTLPDSSNSPAVELLTDPAPPVCHAVCSIAEIVVNALPNLPSSRSSSRRHCPAAPVRLRGTWHAPFDIHEDELCWADRRASDRKLGGVRPRRDSEEVASPVQRHGVRRSVGVPGTARSAWLLAG